MTGDAPMTGDSVPSSYGLRRIEGLVGEDEGTAELGVHLSLHGDRVFVTGRVTSARARQRVLTLVREHCPDHEVVDELSVSEQALSTPPAGAEEIR